MAEIDPGAPRTSTLALAFYYLLISIYDRFK
jgi:hypothetical protein